MIVVIILAGMFHDFILFITLLFVHELGHSMTGILLGWHLNKIKFFPYGGVSEFAPSFNHPLWQELLVLVMGPISQIGAYFVLSYLVGSGRVEQLQIYHYSLLIFNLLPINPLDGGKFASLLFYSIVPFYKGMKLSIFLSFVVLFLTFFIAFTYYRQMNILLILSIVFMKLLKEKERSAFYYQKFLLERYLSPPHFKRRKVITKVEDMYRDRKHLFFVGRHYKTEQETLAKYFKK